MCFPILFRSSRLPFLIDFLAAKLIFSLFFFLFFKQMSSLCWRELQTVLLTCMPWLWCCPGNTWCTRVRTHIDKWNHTHDCGTKCMRNLCFASPPGPPGLWVRVTHLLSMRRCCVRPGALRLVDLPPPSHHTLCSVIHVLFQGNFFVWFPPPPATTSQICNTKTKNQVHTNTTSVTSTSHPAFVTAFLNFCSCSLLSFYIPILNLRFSC